MLDRRSQTQRIVRKAFTRPIPLAILVIGLLMGGVHWWMGAMGVLLYLIISTSLVFSPNFIKRVVEENYR